MASDDSANAMWSSRARESTAITLDPVLEPTSTKVVSPFNHSNAGYSTFLDAGKRLLGPTPLKQLQEDRRAGEGVEGSKPTKITQTMINNGQ